RATPVGGRRASRGRAARQRPFPSDPRRGTEPAHRRCRQIRPACLRDPHTHRQEFTMTTIPSTDTSTHAVRPIPEFAGVHDVWPRGDRLAAVRGAAEQYRERFRSQGTVRAIKSIDIAAAPYPSRFAFQGYNLSINPMISIINRMFVIQFDGFDGELKTMVWEPTVAAGSAEAPFYAKLQRMAGKFLPDRLFAKYYNDPDAVLGNL